MDKTAAADVHTEGSLTQEFKIDFSLVLKLLQVEGKCKFIVQDGVIITENHIENEILQYMNRYGTK
jgi:hypothetical protein